MTQEQILARIAELEQSKKEVLDKFQEEQHQGMLDRLAREEEFKKQQEAFNKRMEERELEVKKLKELVEAKENFTNKLWEQHLERVQEEKETELDEEIANKALKIEIQQKELERLKEIRELRKQLSNK